MNKNENIQAMIAKILGYEEFYCELYPGNAMASITSRVVIDNTSHQADEVIDRLIGFVDCMLDQLQDKEPDRTTDFFTLVADGERIQFDALELALDGDEPEWSRWKAFRTRFMGGRRLELEHQFISEPNDEVYIDWGLPKLLKDLLEGGKLADYVTLTTILDNGDYTDWHEFRKPYHQDIWKRRQHEDYFPFNGQLFWINGKYNGEYVCGEVPFVRDEAAVMSIESWYQSEQCYIELDDHEGIVLTLAPNAKPEVLERANALAERFYKELPCTVEMKTGLGEPVRFDRAKEPLSREEELHLRLQMASFFSGSKSVDALAIHSQLEEETSRHVRSARNKPTNEEDVRKYLEVFAQIREYFSDKDVDAILNVNTDVQELFTRHAAEKYSENEIRLYRFGICVRMLMEEVIQRANRTKYGFEPEEANTNMGWPSYLYEKVAELPESLRQLPEDMWNQGFNCVGMNDLSAEEAKWAYELYLDGRYIRVFDICLNSMKDILTLENLLNELSSFEAELRSNCDGQILSSNACDETEGKISLLEASGFLYSPHDLWKWLKPEGDPQRSIMAYGGEVTTDREFLDYVLETGDCLVETEHIFNDVVCFESMDMGTRARLRFRRENGHYFHEISMLD